MANLDYCKFRNTATDFEDCVDALRSDDFPESEEELEALERMKALCKEFLEITG